jgi:hypothetical protein
MEIIVINMQPLLCDCAICGEETRTEFGVTINDDGQIVDDDCEEVTGGRTVCKGCFDKAAAGEITSVW